MGFSRSYCADHYLLAGSSLPVQAWLNLPGPNAYDKRARRILSMRQALWRRNWATVIRNAAGLTEDNRGAGRIGGGNATACIVHEINLFVK
jgi:hypothetical protein